MIFTDWNINLITLNEIKYSSEAVNMTEIIISTIVWQYKSDRVCLPLGYTEYMYRETLVKRREKEKLQSCIYCKFRHRILTNVERRKRRRCE